MNLKYIILSVFLLQFITQDINAQNWSEFANTGYYAKANLELKLHSKTENRVVFMGNSITEGWVFMRPEFFENIDYINRGIGGPARLRRASDNSNPNGFTGCNYRARSHT
jgi:hypothetical protein